MGIPEEYQKNYKYFLGSKIDLSFRPLIPRQETEYWVSLILKEIKKGSKCLDLFSGSGCIGVSVLKNIENTFCDFGEIDKNLLKQIQINLEGFEKERYNIIETDVFSNIKERYDFILANPPYVALERIGEVGEDVLEYEPHLALFSGNKGMDCIIRLIKEAPNFLNEKGVLVIEHDESQKDDIEKLIKRNTYSKYEFCKDHFNEYRFVKIYG
ncbi:MAG: HemK family protein methyltransferase [Candidatus Pacebacteria bacterium]|nr:HemK family protein methyltransferase [Candidatus Paceibacterota bacterium]MDD4333529.1 HemK family protein methyltransferase [Candidatus Paceibacterota bacterium]